MSDEARLQSIADPRFRELCRELVATMQRLGVPGAAVGVIDGDAEHIAGFGVTNVDHPLPVDGDTLFQIGSTTKTVTGTTAMRLVEQGRLDLYAPVRTYLPELRLSDADVAAQVTLRHLFSHTAGWVGDYFDDAGNGDDALANIVARMADLPQIAPLGQIWSYNNAAFYLAGRVIEAVTGQTYEAAAQELVLGPLGMHMSYFFAADAITHRVAVGHQNTFEADGNKPKVAQPWALARAANPVGGIISTVRDQLRYARFHIGDGTAADGTRLLTPESLTLMQTPFASAANGEFSGVSWFISDTDGIRLVRHGGATNGQLSAFVMAPAQRFAITVLTNSSRGGELYRDITRRALRTYLGIEERTPEPVTLSEERLAAYVGRYSAPLNDAELALRDGALILQILPNGGFPLKGSPAGPTPPPVRLEFCAADQVIALDTPFKDTRAEFLRDANGEVAWFRFGSRAMARARSQESGVRSQ
jgi:CubicO group peptidase (beta-lactamase class C family)